MEEKSKGLEHSLDVADEKRCMELKFAEHKRTTVCNSRRTDTLFLSFQSAATTRHAFISALLGSDNKLASEFMRRNFPTMAN